MSFWNWLIIGLIELSSLGVDRYVFFRADTDYNRSNRPIELGMDDIAKIYITIYFLIPLIRYNSDININNIKPQKNCLEHPQLYLQTSEKLIC